MRIRIKEKMIPVIIPSYEPDEKIIQLLKSLKDADIKQIIVVDDGSIGEEYQNIFKRIESDFSCIVLHHAVNLGKGRALKTAFNYCLLQYRDVIGCVTIDSDGQHTVKDMVVCMEELEKHPQNLILGVRNFNQAGIPVRSVFGNKFTSKVMKILVGVSVTDTQTGLRAIPATFMKQLLNEKGERFEFETNMLLDTKNQDVSIIEVPIETIYIEDNKTSHFHPLKDSMRIYAVFLKFIVASVSSSVFDLLLFGLFCNLLENMNFGKIGYIVVATVLARVLSATYNFTVNYKVVFHGKNSTAKAFGKYIILATCIMLASGFSVGYLHSIFPIAEILVKIPVDIILFLVSFFIQREYVYR